MKENRVLNKTIAIAAAGVVLLLIWQAAAMLLANNLLPTPLQSFTAFFSLLRDNLAHHFVISTYRVVVSTLVALVLALPLGLYLGQEKKADWYAAPLIYLTYPIPKIVFLPVILLIFGIGDLSKIFLIALIVFFQIAVTARDSSRSVPSPDIVSMQSLGANSWQIYRHVIIPYCLPDILTSLRISLGTAIAVLFFVESFATTEGLGYFIMDAWMRAASDEMFAGIIGMGLLGLILILLVDVTEFYLCRWRRLQAR
ncbi:MAG TPA: ABC transporter permease [Bacillota bacterium]|nr:ABC transporter permease [Bacillota bacterium]